MNDFPAVKFKLLRPGSRLPQRGTEHSGAFDIYAPEDGCLSPHERKKVPTGIAHEVCQDFNIVTDGMGSTQIPFTLHGLLIPRSGLATRGIRLYFSPSLIDADYRGEIMIGLENLSESDFWWEQGDRLAQIAYVPMYMGTAIAVDELSDTSRGTGGFGSTGT
jgi:dUTP pyrophosphatase